MLRGKPTAVQPTVAVNSRFARMPLATNAGAGNLNPSTKASGVPTAFVASKNTRQTLR
jgi:hypothetical protein